MSTILSLPFETLAEIILQLDFLEITKLWMCGDIALNWRLSKGQVVRNIEVKVDDPNLPFWPSVICQLAGLESFRYEGLHDNPETSLTAHELLMLPRKLKKLNLISKSDVEAAEVFFLDSPEHFFNLRSLRLQNVAQKRPLGFVLPSTLEELSLGCPASPMGFLKLSQLPAHLTTLVAFSDEIIVSEEGEDFKFPENLQSLELFTNKHVHFSHLLPSQLEKLTYTSGSATSCTIRNWIDLSRLPLKHLKLSVSGSFDAKIAAQLPRSLTSIVLRNISSDITPKWTIGMLKALPRNLVHLRGIFPDPLPASVIRWLPPTLLWSGMEDIDPSGLAIMPPNTLAVRMATQDGIERISGFPPNLHTLEIRRLTDSVASMLPRPALKNLRISGSLKISQIFLLPRNLETLSVMGEFGKPIEMNALKGLPERLVSLRMVRGGSSGHQPIKMSSPDSSQWFPRTLTHLEIGPIDVLTPEWLYGLPKTLTLLNLKCEILSSSLLKATAQFLELTDLRIINYLTPDDQWQYSLDFLPPKLTRLQLRQLVTPGGKSSLKNSSFLKIPTTITEIEIPPSPYLDKPSYTHLPRLKKLGFGAAFDTPTWFVAPSK